MTRNTRPASLHDRDRLIDVIDRTAASWASFAPQLDSFRRNLGSARVLSPGDVPQDMITMNSRFALSDPESQTRITHTLVYPDAASPERGRISVLTPMGMALFGAREGDEVSWISPDGREVRIVRQIFYQPEAAGHGHC